MHAYTAQKGTEVRIHKALKTEASTQALNFHDAAGLSRRSGIPLRFHQENIGRWVENVELGRSWEPLAVATATIQPWPAQRGRG